MVYIIISFACSLSSLKHFQTLQEAFPSCSEIHNLYFFNCCIYVYILHTYVYVCIYIPKYLPSWNLIEVSYRSASILGAAPPRPLRIVTDHPFLERVSILCLQPCAHSPFTPSAGDCGPSLVKVVFRWPWIIYLSFGGAGEHAVMAQQWRSENSFRELVFSFR